MDLYDFIAEINIYDTEDGPVCIMQEDSKTKQSPAATDHLEVVLLPSVDDFIRKNPSTKEITSPIYFDSKGVPNPEGLFSNEIFGITKIDRSGIFGYIDLHGYFLHPLIYKQLCSMDSRFKNIVYGTKKYTVNSAGELIEDENGKTGLKWLKSVFDSIKLKSTESAKRETKLKFIDANREVMWTNKWLVMPAFYRDVNTANEGKMDVGEINKLYNSLLISSRSLLETEDMGLPTSDLTKGRMQDLILAIYDWICGNNNDAIEGAPGLSKKFGYIKRAGMSKTTDYGSRLVLTAPQLKVEYVDDIMVDVEHISVPLHSVCANFMPFMIFQIKRFFESEFNVDAAYPFIDAKGNKVSNVRVKDPQIQFSDEVIIEEVSRFVHGFSDRFSPIKVTLENDKQCYMIFKGREGVVSNNPEDQNLGTTSLHPRRVTWCDVIYMAAVEVTETHHVLVTRYPMDSYYNQTPAKVVVSSTIETVPCMYNDKFYKYYPKISDDDIGSDTSTKFIDTLRISNLSLDKKGADYDGDQMSVKGIYTKEANEEAEKFITSKAMYIGLDMKCSEGPSKEAVQSIYDLTRVLDGSTLTPSKDIEFA